MSGCVGNKPHSHSKFFFPLFFGSFLERLTREVEERKVIQAHVKSCRMTRAGLNGTSMFLCCMTFQFKIFSMSSFLTKNLSQFRTAASSRTLIENGKRPVNNREQTKPSELH